MFASPFLKPRDAVTVLDRYRQLYMQQTARVSDHTAFLYLGGQTEDDVNGRYG